MERDTQLLLRIWCKCCVCVCVCVCVKHLHQKRIWCKCCVCVCLSLSVCVCETFAPNAQEQQGCPLHPISGIYSYMCISVCITKHIYICIYMTKHICVFVYIWPNPKGLVVNIGYLNPVSDLKPNVGTDQMILYPFPHKHTHTNQNRIFFLKKIYRSRRAGLWWQTKGVLLLSRPRLWYRLFSARY